MTIEIREAATGETRRIDDDSPFSEFIWTDGNYACDCNRALFFARAAGAGDPNTACSDGRFVVRIHEDGVVDDGLAVIEAPGRTQAMFEGDTDAHNAARARLAACAPEMARVLLDAEWVRGGGVIGEDNVEHECPWCRELAPTHTGAGPIGGTHSSDCLWLSLMKKAGVR